MDNYINETFEQQWNELTPITTKSETAEDKLQSVESENNPQKSKRISSPVLCIQLVICLLLLTSLFILKTFMFDAFNVIKAWYDSEITASLYFSGDFSDLDYSHLFVSTADEV